MLSQEHIDVGCAHGKRFPAGHTLIMSVDVLVHNLGNLGHEDREHGAGGDFNAKSEWYAKEGADGSSDKTAA